jgi:hypothetical protein
MRQHNICLIKLYLKVVVALFTLFIRKFVQTTAPTFQMAIPQNFEFFVVIDLK